MKQVFIIISILLNISILKAGDDFQKIINVTWSTDISKRYCSADCGLDNDCKNMKDICNIMVKLPIETVDGEVFKLSLRVISSAITSILNKAVEKKLMKFNDVVAFYVYLDDILPALAKKEFTKSGLMKFNKLDVAEFFIDTAIDIRIEHIVNMMSHKQLQVYRNWPGIHDSASDETIRQALKWMMKLIKNDIKAVAMSVLGSPTRAFQAGVADNAFLLLDIGIKTVGAGFDALDAKTDLVMSKKYGKMMNLFFDYEEFYYKQNKENQQLYLKQFQKECREIKLSLGEFITANWAKIYKKYGASLNARLRNKCNNYIMEMQKTNFQKQFIISSVIKTMPRDRYIKLVNHFYPYEDRDYYMKLYDISNYDPVIGSVPNQQIYKYLKRLNAYGIKILAKNFPQKNRANIKVASILISMIQRNNYNTKIEPSKVLSDSGFSNLTKLTQQKLAKLLNNNFTLSSIKLNKNQKSKLVKFFLLKKYSNRDGVLYALDIIGDDSLNNSEVELTNYAMAKIFSNTLDVLTCGHVGCSYQQILIRWEKQ